MVEIKQVIPLPNEDLVRAAAEPYKPPSWHREDDKYCVKLTYDQEIAGGVKIIMVFMTEGQPCQFA